MSHQLDQPERRIQTACLLILTAIAIGVALYWLRPVLIPFVLALLLVYCLIPAIDLQVRFLRLNRWLALMTTIIFACGILFVLSLLISTSVGQLDTAQYANQFRKLIARFVSWMPLGELGIQTDQVQSLVSQQTGMLGNVLSHMVNPIMGVASNGLLVVIFMIFLLAGGSAVRPKASLRAQIDARVKRYLLAKVLTSSTTGLFVGFTLWLIGVELATLFGLLAFLLNFIPSIGSVVATLLPLPVVLLSAELGTTAKVMAITVPGMIQFTIGNVVEPKMIGQSLDLHPVVILLGLIFFGMIWGIVGMILATPIVAVTKIILERIDETAPVAELLAGRMD